jgi:uncharacterized protein with HEPN domain
MSERDVLLLVDDIIGAAEKILRYTAGMDLNGFIRDEKTADAVTRNFEVMGEAANRLPPKFRSEHSHIPWNRIRGFRNRVVHDYFGIDFNIVWTIIGRDLDPLLESLRSIRHQDVPNDDVGED